jgi:hypothetical protein
MEQQQDQSKGKPYTSNTSQQISLMKSNSQDLIKWILDSSKELEDFERELKGMVRTEGGWYVDPNRSLMNDRGVNAVMRMLRMQFSKGTPLSNLTDDRILAESLDFNIHLVYEFFINEVDWGIEDRYTDRTTLIMMISTIYHNLLVRAKNALQLKLIAESVERQEKVIYGGNDPSTKEPKFWEFWKSKK